MKIIQWINYVIAIIFFICYFYQIIYILISLLKKNKPYKTRKQNRFAVLVCARNEAGVIADIINSIKTQTYNQKLISVFVMADNCTDDTAEIAMCAGAIVYERQNKQLVGKGYALEYLLNCTSKDYPDSFDGYFVFDADNILELDYIEKMNCTFSNGYEIVTSYRNSKNYGDNWISAGYALWFLRESRYLNNSRSLLKTSCAVSGTGFLFSQKILNKMGGWPFYLLTEDIEFSVHHIVNGEKIGFCPDAVLYDEQPTYFSQSWHQRMRWAKGYLQVFQAYGTKLFSGIMKGNFACFDMGMSIMPAIIFTFISVISNLTIGVLSVINGGNLMIVAQSALQSLINIYLTLFVLGAITTVSEWKKIHTSTFKKLVYTLTFPVFMLTYIPISFIALFTKVEWRPIKHHISATRLKAEIHEL